MPTANIAISERLHVYTGKVGLDDIETKLYRLYCVSYIDVSVSDIKNKRRGTTGAVLCACL